MFHPRFRGDNDSVPSQVNASPKLKPITERAQCRIQPTDLVPHLRAHQRTRSADGENVLARVVLPLVYLVRL